MADQILVDDQETPNMQDELNTNGRTSKVGCATRVLCLLQWVRSRVRISGYRRFLSLTCADRSICLVLSIAAAFIPGRMELDSIEVVLVSVPIGSGGP